MTALWLVAVILNALNAGVAYHDKNYHAVLGWMAALLAVVYMFARSI